MSSAHKAWIAATSVGVVEALKDQGLCRWNHAFKSAQHAIKSHIGSLSQAKNLSSSTMVSSSCRLKGKKQSEESLRTVISNNMSSAGRAWIVATSVGVVEALKDQGICRWNYALRLAQKQVKSHVGSLSQTNKFSSSTMVSASSGLKGQKQSEESLRTVMYLSCWGPN
ncbi:hypothetical protein Fmac_021708 [Flemingia macrophylla]|uniref:Wound-responsive family protein n=1 Tax=Flemingia macrophylla TaxID=520843 RepID=A0ABD1LXR8_9FABA